MSQFEFDFNPRKAMALRDDGMNRSECHADLEDKEFSRDALDAVREYSHINIGVCFLAERVREWAYHTKKVRSTRNARAWGSIMRKAASQRIIRKIGYGITQNVKTHCTPAAMWTAA